MKTSFNTYHVSDYAGQPDFKISGSNDGEHIWFTVIKLGTLEEYHFLYFNSKGLTLDGDVDTSSPYFDIAYHKCGTMIERWKKDVDYFEELNVNL